MADLSKMKKADLIALLQAQQADQPTPEEQAIMDATGCDREAAAKVVASLGAKPSVPGNTATAPDSRHLPTVTFREAVTNQQTGKVNAGKVEAIAHVDKPGYVTFQPTDKDGAMRVGGAKSSRPGQPTGYKRVRTSFIRAIIDMPADQRDALLDAADGDGLRSIADLA